MSSGYITITLKDFLFNAGVVGFIKVLRQEGFNLEDQDIGNTIHVPVSLLENFHENYIKALLNTFQNETLYQSLINQFEHFAGIKPEDIPKEEYKSFIEKLCNKLTSASYKSGYQIIAEKGDDFDVLSRVKMLKTEKDIQKSVSICYELIQYMKKHRETLCMKDIIYTKIIMFWRNVAFFERSNIRKDIKECYYNYFVKPALEYLNRKNKGALQCIQCGNPINASLGMGMSWLNDVGIDMERKRSHFWNFNPDTYICPVCALVYSCVPLGFTVVGGEAIFINNNESIHTLVAEKDIFERGGEKYTTLNQLYYKVLYSFIDDAAQEQTREIQNIQIIRRVSVDTDTGKYVFNTLSKPLLEILKACKSNFKNLINWTFKKDKDTYVNVYQEVANNFFSGRNQYALVHAILQKVFTENLRAPYVRDILQIQRRRMRKFYSEEGGSEAMYISRKEFDAAYNEGLRIRREYANTVTNVKGDNDKNMKINESLRSFVYPLLLALKTKDKAKFNDTMFRFYVGRNESIPKILIEMQQSDEKFQMLGYTFIAGLQGESLNSENAENIVNEEGE
ncbi:CRISPR-associated protein Cas8a1/Cst1 [Thermoclostridium stercorarium subsp. stercorarium DSM 8532]|uniref:CRISPR-associated protein Cas8a1/Cst1 n=4 Tax=Thermoclostridium stercorarium TaxID=1510 RepID=L7VKK7_THES1|nr:type I-B CRISPR-associated protein Cas8b1/Cst1 [Thermoclostridium stercorarium]AGC68640.1 CRISPR-associated protein Cas8a1/Cst1 [Thermoclostridium stercorarium subsp. stercorarium DSM 8532]AGI39652.1 CRISPR protein [Thermoclostridium stercorarium subsp. stercorarium DSM 8532]ANW98983.1 type I-B CRISPR-associated protein Cas8b1/Cst1 [Thermoclostridium stercorarium subsp. thermolacticum DSM 2910]ANX01510.1 type I-B CRISPR-associated protein Cas8b1/Cst1 [Thermoclostridium stercorarium subsp. le